LRFTYHLCCSVHNGVHCTNFQHSKSSTHFCGHFLRQILSKSVAKCRKCVKLHLLPQVKFDLHRSDFHEALNRSRAVRADRPSRILSQIGQDIWQARADPPSPLEESMTSSKSMCTQAMIPPNF